MWPQPRLRRTLWSALVISLLLHVTGIFSEEVYFWLTKPEFEQTELKLPSQKLKSMTLADGTRAKLAGIKPVDSFDIHLHQPGKRPSPPSSQPKPPVRKIPIKSRLQTKQTPATTADAKATLKEVSKSASPISAVAASQPETLNQAEASTIDASPSSRIKEPENPPEATTDTALAHYPSELNITYVYGIIPARMTWKIHDGHYELHMGGGFLGKSRTFISRGKIDKLGVKPEQFIEYRDNAPTPRYQADFDWTAMRVTMGEPGKRKTESFAVGDQDIFSAAFHIGLIGGNGAEHNFSIFSGRRKYANASLHLAGEAKLRLGQKEVTALLLRGEWDDRRAEFWLAPEWNNIPVRITFTMKELELDIWANEITIEGKKVLEWVKPGNTQSKRPRDHSSNR